MGRINNRKPNQDFSPRGIAQQPHLCRGLSGFFLQKPNAVEVQEGGVMEWLKAVPDAVAGATVLHPKEAHQLFSRRLINRIGCSSLLQNQDESWEEMAASTHLSHWGRSLPHARAAKRPLRLLFTYTRSNRYIHGQTVAMEQIISPLSFDLASQ